MDIEYVEECDCEDFKSSWPQIIGAQMLAANHGMPYTAKMINYCPWCGKKLRRLTKRYED